MSLCLDHVALPAFDAAGTLHFYTEIIGLPLVEALSGEDWGGSPWLMMVFGLEGSGTLVLCALRGVQRPAGDGLPQDVHHFAFAAASMSELQAWKERLRAHSIGFTEEDHGRQHSLYFEDPNGHLLEITATASEASPSTNVSAVARATAWIEGR